MYRSSATIEAILRELPRWTPWVTRIPLANSHGGRPVSAIRLRVGPATERDGVLFVGGLHAREAMNPDLLVDFVLALLAHQNSDWPIGLKTWPAATLSLILRTFDIFVLPNANPDGREVALGSNRMWRKNTRLVEYRPYPERLCIGVDLNRNFDLIWGKRTLRSNGTEATSRHLCSDLFCGPSAFSEIETRNVKRLLDDYPITCMVDLHSFGELILHPWGHAPVQTTDPTQRFTQVNTGAWSTLPTDAPSYREYIPAADLQRFETVGRSASEAIRDVRPPAASFSDRPRPNYVVQPGSSLYPATGTSADYAYARHIENPARRKVYGFTFETGQRNYWSEEESFQPAPGEASRVKEEVSSGLLAILACQLCPVDVIGRNFPGAGADSMRALRSMRDRRLAESDAGRSWIAAFDRHRLELVNLMGRDPKLVALAGELIVHAGELLRSDEKIDGKVRAKLLRLLKQLSTKRLSSDLKRELLELQGIAKNVAGRRASEVVEDLTRRPSAAARHERRRLS